jgi:hypothetical protein
VPVECAPAIRIAVKQTPDRYFPVLFSLGVVLLLSLFVLLLSLLGFVLFVLTSL